MNNKRAIKPFFETLTLTTQLEFYLFKVNNGNSNNTRARCEMYLKSAVRTPERRERHESGVFIVNFQQILHLHLVFLSVNFT